MRRGCIRRLFIGKYSGKTPFPFQKGGRDSAAHKRSSLALRYRDSGEGSPPFCGFPSKGRTKILAGPACRSHELRRQSLSLIHIFHKQTDESLLRFPAFSRGWRELHTGPDDIHIPKKRPQYPNPERPNVQKAAPPFPWPCLLYTS